VTARRKFGHFYCCEIYGRDARHFWVIWSCQTYRTQHLIYLWREAAPWTVRLEIGYGKPVQQHFDKKAPRRLRRMDCLYIIPKCNEATGQHAMVDSKVSADCDPSATFLDLMRAHWSCILQPLPSFHWLPASGLQGDLMHSIGARSQGVVPRVLAPWSDDENSFFYANPKRSCIVMPVPERTVPPSAILPTPFIYGFVCQSSFTIVCQTFFASDAHVVMWGNVLQLGKIVHGVGDNLIAEAFVQHQISTVGDNSMKHK